MLETFKIGRACFIGGAVCCAVALLVAPALWWLGIFAGLAGGYVAYEFREILGAIPAALTLAKNGVAGTCFSAFSVIAEWAQTPHPFFYTNLAFAVIALCTLPRVFIVPISELDLATFILGAMIWFCIFAILALVFRTMAEVGAQTVERVYWVPTCEGSLYNHEMPLNFANVYRWFLKGCLHSVRVVVLFLCWSMWKYSAIAIWTAIVFIGLFCWHLVRLIHSDRRVLCSIDGTLGGIIALAGFFLTEHGTPSMLECLTVICFGGLIGAAFGIANWELISKRVFGYGTTT